MATKCFYSVIEHDSEARHRCNLPQDYCLQRQLEVEDVAELCADDFHNRHGGWESEWPLTFAIYDSEEGDECCRVTVERETCPVFAGRMIRE